MSALLVHELHEARDRILLLKQKLESVRPREMPAYRVFLDEQIGVLDRALLEARIPERYRVAVVGRFKVGKSSFVNKLAQEMLAGVDTSPETAAISVFRYGDSARAEIEFVSAEEWAELRQTYAEDPKSGDVKRYAGFAEFNDRVIKKDGKEVVRERVDLARLESEWLQSGRRVHEVVAGDWKTRDGKRAFRRELKKFTSSQEPLHYFVNKLTIYAPIPILQDHIEIVDTPGLDDTERFRVKLTEDLVRDVDAILYLTTSGAAYSASDKEFLVRQLRQKQIKHLQVIVTKADETFENARRDAKDNDDDPPDFERFRANEVTRVRTELKRTLDELLTSNQLKDEDGYYYISQLDGIPVHLISTKLHDEGRADHGGIDAVRDGLYTILSTSQRFADARGILVDRLQSALTTLAKRFGERVSAIESEYDPQKVKAEIQSIHGALTGHLDFFATEAAGMVEVMEGRQRAFTKTLQLHLDNVGLMARDVVSTHERDDVARHWKSRRAGYWGYLSNLGSIIADRIFPKVEGNLNELRAHLAEFMRNVGGRLSALQAQIRKLEEEHRLSGLEPLSIAESQRPVFDELDKMFSALAESERDSIVAKLEEFVTAEVQTRLSASRVAVKGILGTGTTVRQRGEVEEFYDTVKSLLGDALRSHVEGRLNGFAAAIMENARSVAPRIRQATLDMIEQRLHAIESTLALQTNEQKQRVLTYLQEVHAFVANFAALPETTLPATTSSVALPGPEDCDPVAHGDSLRQPVRYEIVDGATGYTYERIYRPYIDDAETITVEDPFIRKPYQFENFARFCALALRLGHVKKIELKSYCDFGEDIDEVRARLETLRRDLLSRGVELTFSYEFRGHDRAVHFSNGWTVEVGRGLDIYYPPESWISVEATDFWLRRCKGTKVRAFRAAA